jgi:hypothetical protein
MAEMARIIYDKGGSKAKTARGITGDKFAQSNCALGEAFYYNTKLGYFGDNCYLLPLAPEQQGGAPPRGPKGGLMCYQCPTIKALEAALSG